MTRAAQNIIRAALSIAYQREVLENEDFESLMAGLSRSQSAKHYSAIGAILIYLVLTDKPKVRSVYYELKPYIKGGVGNLLEAIIKKYL